MLERERSIERKRNELRSDGAVATSGMLRREEYDGGALGDWVCCCVVCLVRAFIRFVLRVRRNWSVKSLAHVSLRPSGTAERLPRLVGVRLAMIVERWTKSSDIRGCERRKGRGGDYRRVVQSAIRKWSRT